MKNTLYIICLLLLAVPAVYGDADVDAVRLDRQNGELVVRIDASSQFQFSHQTEEAKDGKPFRVIVDLFPAVHKLGQKSFVDLPPAIVQAIRSSQYAVEPNKTVRVVLDLKEESVYRIEKSGNSIFIYIPDSKGADFPAWSSAEQLKPHSPVEKPPAVAEKKAPVKTEQPKPQMTAAPESKPKVETKAAPQVATTPQTAAPETTFIKPQRSGLVEQDWVQSNNTPAPVSTPVVAKAQEKPAVEKKVTVKSPETTKPSSAELKSDQPVKNEVKESTESVTPKTELTATEPKNTKSEVKSAAPVVKPETEETAQVEPNEADTTPAQDNPAQLVVKEQPEEEQEEEDSKSTSRFRRQPAFPAKLKGTIVAEFPKRMVIQYSPGISRDPFASLMDETKPSDNPLDKKIPDVETARLVGVLESSDGQNRALLEDMEGYGFILKSGDKVKKGYVSQIYSDKALFQIFEYGWSRTVALHLDENE
ncbi:MAG: AMIN domain-containing protein [Candidatus Zixiibacteriota bacterium]